MKSPCLEKRRALFHFTLVGSTVALSYVLTKLQESIGLGIVLLGFILFEIARKISPKFNKYSKDKLFKGIMRKKEINSRTSGMDGLLGIILSLFLFPVNIFRAGILILAISDPLARIFGESFGKKKLPWIFLNKTYIGSFSFFISALILALFFTTPISAIAGALTATFFEALPDKKYLPTNDNFNIPVSAGLAIIIALKIM